MSYGKESSIPELARRIAIEAGVHEAYRGGADYDRKDVFQGLSSVELYSLVEDLSCCDGVDEAYTLMAQMTDDGRASYYDRLFAPTHELAYEGLAAVLKQTERRRVSVAVDLGGGTGENAATLARHAKRVMVVDANRAMLQVAQRKLESRLGTTDKFEFVVGDVLGVEIAPESVDLAVDNGLLPYLSQDQIDGYWTRLGNWLKPGGRYYTFDSAQQSSELFSTSLRAQLAGLAVSLVLRHSHVQEQRHNPPPTHLAQQYGFSLQLFKLQLEPFKAGVVQWTKEG